MWFLQAPYGLRLNIVNHNQLAKVFPVLNHAQLAKQHQAGETIRAHFSDRSGVNGFAHIFVKHLSASKWVCSTEPNWNLIEKQAKKVATQKYLAPSPFCDLLGERSRAFFLSPTQHYPLSPPLSAFPG